MARSKNISREINLPSPSKLKIPGTGAYFPDAIKNLIFHIDLTKIHPDSLNPRRYYDQSKLEEMAKTIKKHEVLEAILVRPKDPAQFDQICNVVEGGKDPNDFDFEFKVVHGERRRRSSILANKRTIPLTIRNLTDNEALEIMLIENLQREDLNVIEQARSFKSLMGLGYRQNQIAEKVGLSQEAISNSVRLLKLPDNVLELVAAGKLSAGHGRSLLRFADFSQIINGMVNWLFDNRDGEVSVSVKELDKDTIPGRFYLKNKGLVRHLNDFEAAKFDWEKICKTCSFGAYRRTDDAIMGNSYCLKPEHFDELQTDAERRIEEELKRKLEKIQSRDGQKKEKIPSLKELGYERYRKIERSYGRKAPSGCSDRCSCRAMATDYDDNLIEICLDPKKFDQFEKQDEKIQKAERRTKYEKWLLKALEALPELSIIDSDDVDRIKRRLLAILVCGAIPTSRISILKESMAIWGIDIDPKLFKDYGQQYALCDALSKLDPTLLLQFTAEVVFRNDAAELINYPRGYKNLKWFLEIEKEGEEDENEDEENQTGGILVKRLG